MAQNQQIQKLCNKIDQNYPQTAKHANQRKSSIINSEKKTNENLEYFKNRFQNKSETDRLSVCID